MSEKFERRGTCVGTIPHYPRGMFFLTRRESLVIVLAMIALTIGAGVRHYRLAAQVAHDSSTR